MSQVKDLVRAFVFDNFLMGNAARLGDAESFLENHVLDSTGFLELVAFLEEKFGISVMDEEMTPENLDSLNSIELFVRNKQLLLKISVNV